VRVIIIIIISAAVIIKVIAATLRDNPQLLHWSVLGNYFTIFNSFSWRRDWANFGVLPHANSGFWSLAETIAHLGALQSDGGTGT